MRSTGRRVKRTTSEPSVAAAGPRRMSTGRDSRRLNRLPSPRTLSTRWFGFDHADLRTFFSDAPDDDRGAPPGPHHGEPAMPYQRRRSRGVSANNLAPEWSGGFFRRKPQDFRPLHQDWAPRRRPERAQVPFHRPAGRPLSETSGKGGFSCTFEATVPSSGAPGVSIRRVPYLPASARALFHLPRQPGGPRYRPGPLACALRRHASRLRVRRCSAPPQARECSTAPARGRTRRQRAP